MITDAIADALVAYANALDGGEPPAHADFLRDYPTLRDDLAPLLAQVDLLHRVRRAPWRSATPPASALGADTRLGDFRVVGVLGRGGMGIVYEAIQHSLGRRVALKVVPGARDRDPRERGRFLHEARTAALLHHEHIVPVYAVGEADDVQYYAMQLITGPSLAAVLRALRGPGPLASAPTALAATPATTTDADGSGDTFATAAPPGSAAPPDPAVAALGAPGSAAYLRAVVALIAQAADALAYAHAMGVIHRDVKPGNLLLDRQGKLWLTDFGLAHAGDGGITLGRPVGTPRYCAPEQVDPRRGPPDGRADLYGLGATLYELLGFRPAHAGRDDAAMLHHALHVEPVPIRRHAPAVPPDLATVVHKALAKDPADRYATAAELAADLRRFLDGRPVLARPLSRPQRAVRWARRHRRGLAAAGVALACGLILGLAASTTVFFRGKLRAEDRERQLLEVVKSLNGAEMLFRNRPGAGAGHRVLVRQLKEVLTRLADEPGATAAVRWEAANACLRLATMEEREGHREARHAATGEAVRRLRDLARDEPGHPDYRLALARALRFEASLVIDRESDRPAASRLAREALALYEALQREDPARAEYRNDVSELCVVVASDHAARGEHDAALAAMRRGLAADTSLARQFPDGHPLSYIRLAGTWHALGGLHAQAGDPDRAEEALRHALANDAILAARFPDPPNTRLATFGHAGSLGRLLLARGRYPEARAAFAACLADARRFRDLYPDQPWWRGPELESLRGLADATFLEGREPEARARYAELVAALRATPDPGHLQVARLIPFPEAVAGLDVPTPTRPADDTPMDRYVLALGRLRHPGGADLAAAADAFAALIDRCGHDRAAEGAARYRHAQALARLGRRGEARRAFDAADRLDPGRFAPDGEVAMARREAALALAPEPESAGRAD
jgi:serine/threonine protein kinase/tetratricopeptide (TPR) repeat protein